MGDERELEKIMNNIHHALTMNSQVKSHQGPLRQTKEVLFLKTPNKNLGILNRFLEWQSMVYIIYYFLSGRGRGIPNPFPTTQVGKNFGH